MDYDRKSVGSSFYGRRQSSDVLQRDFPDPRARQDEVSSFYGGPPSGAARPSIEMLNQPNSAGYNNSSYFDAGRAEPVKGAYDEEAGYRDEPFDIYADFNNQGPRYSKAAFIADDGYALVCCPRLVCSRIMLQIPQSQLADLAREGGRYSRFGKRCTSGDGDRAGVGSGVGERRDAGYD